jgi:hypothetical protein
VIRCHAPGMCGDDDNPCGSYPPCHSLTVLHNGFVLENGARPTYTCREVKRSNDSSCMSLSF